MEWYVYYHNYNKDKIEKYNIFDHGRFNQYVKKYLNECETKEEFAEELDNELAYYFMCRAEWEVVVGPWCGSRNNKPIKIDVYDQVMLNWDAFVDYVWSHKEEV